jgi:hypothetical protein
MMNRVPVLQSTGDLATLDEETTVRLDRFGTIVGYFLLVTCAARNQESVVSRAPCKLTDGAKYGRRWQKKPRTERDPRGIARGLRTLQNRSEGTGNPRHLYLSASLLESPPKRVRKGLRRTFARGIRSSQQKKEHKGRVAAVAKWWWSGRPWCEPETFHQRIRTNGGHLHDKKGPSSVAGEGGTVPVCRLRP